MKPLALKFIISLLTCINLSSCVTTRSLDENMQDLQSGKVAVVVSGCWMKWRETSWILPDEDKETSCATKWKSSSGTDVTFSEYTRAGVNFISPGTYEFTGFSGTFGNKIIFYDRKPDSPSILEKFSVKGGEVIYIGDFIIDTRNTKLVLQSIQPIQYDKVKYLKGFSKKDGYSQYGILAKKLKDRIVHLTPAAEFAKYALPVLEKK